MTKKALTLLIALVALASCATQREITYFQNIQPDVEFDYNKGTSITVQPDDMIYIVVSSKNPELASMFNLSKIQQTAGGMSNSSTSGSSAELSAYTVNTNGYIDFPVLGEIHIAGQTKEQIATTIKNELISKQLINDPIVSVSFVNLQFYLLGEVASPGAYSIEKNQTTILEAISLAGDLTIYGLRDRVSVTRTLGDKKVLYELDLRNEDIYQSPAFYVQQNDLIYVEPNKVKANQSTANGNSLQSISFWMSLASFITSLSLIFII